MPVILLGVPKERCPRVLKSLLLVLVSICWCHWFPLVTSVTSQHEGPSVHNRCAASRSSQGTSQARVVLALMQK